MARRAQMGEVRSVAWVVAALLLCAGLASAQTSPASAPARSAAAATPPAAATPQTAPAAKAPAPSPTASTTATPAVATGVSTGSSTPSLAGAGAASAPNANDVALAKPTDSSMTAVSAQLLLVGPDAWPFEDDRQAQLITALKGDLMWSTGRFPDPLKYVVTDVRSSSAGSAPPGRKLLQAMNSLVTVQIDAGTIDLVGNVRSNLVTDVNNGNILSRCKSAGLKLTAIQMASAIYATPQKPKPDTRPQLAAGIAVAGCIVFAFVGWIIYLESEKSRSCCGYTWGRPAMTGKPAPEAKPTTGGLRGLFNREKQPAVVEAGHDNTPGKTGTYKFDDPPAGTSEVAMQPQGASAVPVSTPAAGIGRHRLP